MAAYFDFPQEHGKHLRATKPVESPFNAVRLRSTSPRRFKKVENATAMIWQRFLIAEIRFRKLNAPSCWRECGMGRGRKTANVGARAKTENSKRWEASRLILFHTY